MAQTDLDLLAVKADTHSFKMKVTGLTDSLVGEINGLADKLGKFQEKYPEDVKLIASANLNKISESLDAGIKTLDINLKSTDETNSYNMLNLSSIKNLKPIIQAAKNLIPFIEENGREQTAKSLDVKASVINGLTYTLAVKYAKEGPLQSSVKNMQLASDFSPSPDVFERQKVGIQTWVSTRLVQLITNSISKMPRSENDNRAVEVESLIKQIELLAPINGSTNSAVLAIASSAKKLDADTLPLPTLICTLELCKHEFQLGSDKVSAKGLIPEKKIDEIESRIDLLKTTLTARNHLNDAESRLGRVQGYDGGNAAYIGQRLKDAEAAINSIPNDKKYADAKKELKDKLESIAQRLETLLKEFSSLPKDGKKLAAEPPKGGSSTNRRLLLR
jgi:hypothetical protein